MQYIWKCLLIALFATSTAFADEPVLYIKSGTQINTFSRSQLLGRPDVTMISTTDDPFFKGKTMVYKAVPAAALFKGIVIPSRATIAFKALDGFSAPIAKEKLLNVSSRGSIAYIAIETPEDPWPVINPGVDDRTCAPFYLIWKDPQKSKISPEEWPMQLAGFVIGDPFAKKFPHIAPDEKLNANDPVMLGFRVFTTNCLSCHTMNREGDTKYGPDLNVPYNPTEYFSNDFLRKYIRDPRNVRYWPQEKMNPFPESVISETEMDHLIAYLKYMSKRKMAPDNHTD